MDKPRKFVIKQKSLDNKEDATVTMTLRLSRELQQKYDEIAQKSIHSRNELMNMALLYALDNLEFEE